ncbi:helix-turn-helix transcriptional regulator [Nitratireductor sp. GISD-1A_MAKvit]|uniref:helix-turn-helix domain-containing protein n=1 Tax=Nitratireductor sp. GISD-1A_MAKvit TaxID=3234198 RepID=UPI00346598CC
MTPLGEKIRQLRRARGISQKEMAASIGVSAAYLSSLEHGKASPPNWAMIQKIIGFFNVIWDEADEMQRIAELSHPRVVVDTARLAPQATELANLLAAHIGAMRDEDIDALLVQLKSLVGDRSTQEQ